jgi:hypothetical protein
MLYKDNYDKDENEDYLNIMSEGFKEFITESKALKIKYEQDKLEYI